MNPLLTVYWPIKKSYWRVRSCYLFTYHYPSPFIGLGGFTETGAGYGSASIRNGRQISALSTGELSNRIVFITINLPLTFELFKIYWTCALHSTMLLCAHRVSTMYPHFLFRLTYLLLLCVALFLTIPSHLLLHHFVRELQNTSYQIESFRAHLVAFAFVLFPTLFDDSSVPANSSNQQQCYPYIAISHSRS